MVDFRYYINRQGPRGQQGAKGEQGYSPQVIVGKNTASEFTLKVINEDGSFETENLKAVPEDRGGTYVRYDKDTYQEYIGDPDFASTERYGVVRLATKEDLGTQEESRAVTSALLNTYLQENYLNKVHGDVVTGDVSFRGDTGFLNAPHIDKIKDDLNNQYITRNVSNYTTEVGSLTIPDGITARMIQGGKEIAYTSDLTEFVTNAVLNSAISNLVTLDTDQTITGKKTFGGETTFNAHTWTSEQEAVNLNVTSLATMKNVNVSGTLTSNGEINAVAINAAGIKNNQNNKYYLTQGSITPGDNVTIEETTDGVKISSIGGGGGASINDSTISSTSTWSSSKINSTKNDNIFDIGKFTVVGSPTITDDGILQGTKEGTALVVSNISQSNNELEISFDYIYKKRSGYVFPAIIDCLDKDNNHLFAIGITANENRLSFGGNNKFLVVDTRYKFKIKTDLKTYRSLYIDNVLLGTVNIETPMANISSIYIGNYRGALNDRWDASYYDLKHFSITVDGEEVFKGLMESTKPIYDKISATNTELSTFQTDTDNNFSAVNSALNEKANLSDLANYVPLTTYNALLARVVALETQIDGGIA